MSISISLTVNGVARDIPLDDPRVTLLDLLRERLDLTGTKKGCDRGQCGACTVLVDGRRINSCLALALSCDGAHVHTIEGVAQDSLPRRGLGNRRAWQERGGPDGTVELRHACARRCVCGGEGRSRLGADPRH